VSVSTSGNRGEITLMYTVTLTPDDNGTVLVTCPELPEVTTFGEDEDEALLRAADAIEEALAARIARREDLPLPGPPGEFGRREVCLPPLTVAKVELYRAMRARGISKAQLGRRLGWHGPQVDRLLDLNHRSTIEHLEEALRALGKRLGITVADAA
jgi:antitoxin HicB